MASLDRVLNDSIRWNAASFRERRSISNSSRHDVAQLPPTHVLPKLDRWHVTSQDRLIYHLRQVWPERAPRTMLDIGCHAGHGPRGAGGRPRWQHPRLDGRGGRCAVHTTQRSEDSWKSKRSDSGQQLNTTIKLLL